MSEMQRTGEYIDMWNIVRAQNYQLRRDNYIINVFIIIIAITVGAMLMDGFLSYDAATYISAGLSENFLLILIALMFIVTRCSGWDYNDKTINYELMTGHSRKEVYWGRVISAVLWGCIGSMVIMLIPIMLLAIIGGWGNSVDWYNIGLRFVLVFFPMFRMTGLYVLISTRVRSSSKGLLLGSVVLESVLIFTSLLEELADISVTYHFGFSNAMELVSFSNAKEVLIDGKVVSMADTSVDPSFVMATVIVSLIIGFIYLFAGYNYFRKTDRD